MLFPIEPGNALDDAEAAHVDETLVRLIKKAQSKGGDWSISMESRVFLARELKWPGRRYADMRDYVESLYAKDRIGMRVGQAIETYVCRKDMSVRPAK